jgi:hypothetical protein
LFVENKNEEVFCCLPPSETQSSCFMKWCFTFRFIVSI